MTCCPTCRTDQDETGACPACTYRVLGCLAELPRLVVLLEDLLHPNAGPARRGGGGRAHSPVPVDLRVLDLLGPGQPVLINDPHGDQTGGIPLTALLYGWARYIASEHPAVRRDRHGTAYIDRCDSAWSRRGGDVAAWCAWLAGYVPYAMTRPWAGELHDQLEDAVRRARALAGTVVRRTPKDAPCPSCSAFALVGTDGEWHIACEACGHRLTPDEYDAHRGEVMPALAAIALHAVLPRITAA